MRWSSLLAAIALPIVTLAAKSAAGEERFDHYHTQSLSASPIKLKDRSYKGITATPRDYAVVVLLTALEARFGCQLCREFQPEWDLIGKSWTKGDKKGDSRVLFGTLDFADGRDTFMSLGLQTAPVLMFFPPTTGKNSVSNPEPIRYDFTSAPQTAEQVHSWIARHLPEGPHPPVKRPINWFLWIGTISGFALFGTVIYKAGPYILPLLQNRNLWAFVCVACITAFCSGHMFNNIRKVPYVVGDGKGGISYIAGGFQNQIGLESQIIAAIYAILAFSAISLIVKAPRIKDPKTQQFAVVAWGFVLLVIYSTLLMIFRMKNGGYPFFLPPFM